METNSLPADNLLAAKVADLVALGGGTLSLPDGVYTLAQPLRLPWNISLAMTPGATLRALPEFQGEAVVVKETNQQGVHACFGSIRGGTIDGGGLPITGVQVPRACRLHIGDLEIRNAGFKGIDVMDGWYEVNISNVRCALDPTMPHAPGSVGLHYRKCTDSLINGVVIIGYETGVRSDSSSNDFQQVHVWNFPDNGPLKYCFYCGGWNDSYNQCYADSPFDGDNVCYGFYVHAPFTRISNGRIYCNNFAVEGKVTGIYLAPGGTHGSYLGNHFFATDGHRMGHAFAGNFDAACIFGNSFDRNILDGLVCRIPSGGGGDSRMPEVRISG